MTMQVLNRPERRQGRIFRTTLSIIAARLLTRASPKQLVEILTQLSRGARPATYRQAGAARNAVISRSRRCAGEACLERSLATALLCRTYGTWPVWRVGIKADPFSGHAWVEVDGTPVGEPFPAGRYAPILTVAAPSS